MSAIALSTTFFVGFLPFGASCFAGRTSSWKRIVVRRQRAVADADGSEVLLRAHHEAAEGDRSVPSITSTSSW